MKYLKDLQIRDRCVLMRVDFNVPLDENQEITDDTRIKESLNSIQYILENNAKLILMSHLGRPTQKDLRLSLKPCRKRLEELLSYKVTLAPDCIGEEVRACKKNLSGKEILLLENLRFHPEEENPSLDFSFAKQLAEDTDVYVDDAFASMHRNHSSTVTVAQYFPQNKGAGFLVEKELSYLRPLLNHPKHPFYAIIGGAKISTKLGVLSKLIDKVDGLFIGGGMVYTFLRAMGVTVGDSLVEESELIQASHFLNKYSEKIHLPRDQVISTTLKDSSEIKIINIKDNFNEPWMGVDIGPQTSNVWSEYLKKAETIFWNGPMGVFETKGFEKGTITIAKLISTSKGLTIVGGGDSLAAIQKFDLTSCFSHLCTGGGASLEYIELGHLPGLDALE